MGPHRPMARAKKVRFEAFGGFPKEAIAFLRELEANNEREWFQANKGRYEEALKAPFDAIVDDLEGPFGVGKRFRIYRDVRFSKDKTPYKTHGSAVFERKGLVFYVHLEKDHLFAATGMHMMARDQLKRFYAAVDDAKTGPTIMKLVEEAEAAGLEIGGEALKTVARGYPKDHPRVRLLRHKGLTTSRRWEWKKRPPKWLGTPEAGERVVAAWREPVKLTEWLAKHVGPSEEGRRWVKR